MNRHLDELDGLPVTSGGHYDPTAGASWAPGAGGAAGASCVPGSTASGEDDALVGDVVERVRVGPYMADVQLERRDGGLWIACALISTETGVLSWCGAATEQEVAQRLARGRRTAAASGFDFGRFLNNLGGEIERGAQQLARNRTLRRVVRDVNTTLNRPELQPVLAIAQQIPYLGQALGAVRAAATLADRVLQGNPRAQGNLRQIRAAAERGNPIARQAMEVLNDVLRSQQSSAQQRAGSRPPPGRRPARPRPARQRHPSSHRPSSHRPSPRRRPRQSSIISGASSAEESAWRAASERWSELAETQGGGPLVTPPPAAR